MALSEVERWASTMKLQAKLKTALSENRLLILGAQVVFGFQFDGIFQDQFDELPGALRVLACSGLTLLMLTIGCLVTPSMHHRIVERGQDSPGVLRLATTFAGWALVPLAVALAFDVLIALERIGGAAWGVALGAAFFIAAMALWFVLEFWLRRKKGKAMPKTEAVKATPLEAQVDQLLTEARLIIPGAQALLGFQLTVTLTRAFAELPPGPKIAHAAALCCVALAVILLMAPASLHRISYAGEDDPQFVKTASLLVVAAPLPLALAIALDTYVAAFRALSSPAAAAALALVATVALLSMWYIYPVLRRMQRRPAR